VSRLAAVVVHWRDFDETLGCVRSLATEPDVEVIVVDNGSRDDAARRRCRERCRLENRRPQLRLGVVRRLMPRAA
jgi:GT2 family glycosyltransferase